MKYNKDLKIEFKLGGDPYSNSRYVYYRILPSELPWFKRIFYCNPYYQLYHAYNYISGVKYRFTAVEFQKILKKLNTWGDVCDYLEEQREIIDDRRNKAIEKGEIWPDE